MVPRYGVQTGRESALTTYGLDKIAGIGDYLYGVGKNFLIGSPSHTLAHWDRSAAQRGVLGTYGKELKDYHWEPHRPGNWKITPWFWRALSLGQTGLDVHQAVTSDPNSRVGNVTGAVTSALVGPVTAPFGVAGMFAHGAIVNAARGLGHRFDPKPEDDLQATGIHKVRPPYNPTPTTLAHLGYATSDPLPDLSNLP